MMALGKRTTGLALLAACMPLATRALVAALALATLASCAFLGEPASTEDLLVRFAANPHNADFTAKGNVDLTLTLAGYRVPVPLSVHAKAAEGSIHATVDANTTTFMDKNLAYEIYAEQQEHDIVAYVRDSADVASPWNEVRISLSYRIDIPAIVDILSQARFMRVSYDSDDQVRYDLALPVASVVRAIFERGDVSTSFGEISRDDLEDVLAQSVLHVSFTKDCLVRSVSLDLDYTAKGGKELARSLRVDMDARVTFDDHGKVEPDAASVPDTVRASAKPTEDPLGLDDVTDQLDAYAQ